MKKIAIIIPAYKHIYLEETLESIAIQDLSDCHIYIGDDASPYPIASIVKKFEQRIPLSYTKFEDNLGGHDLVAQWNRCVALSQGEEWIWLFSDDDLMCPDCIRHVKDYISKYNGSVNVYHINGTVIDNNQNEIRLKTIEDFPEYLSSQEYLNRILRGRDNTWGINFIVRSERFIATGGFVNFDLAWNADRASWLLFSFPKGIRTINAANLKWRYSGINITAQKADKDIYRRKLFARMEFQKWLYSNYLSNNALNISRFTMLIYALRNFKGDKHASLLLRLSVFWKTLLYLGFFKL